MDDHDQRFKALLHEFLPEFFELFFPDWAPRFDFAGTEWLEQEAFPDPPTGDKRVLDVVAKVPTREPVPDPGGRAADHFLVIINVEVEWPERSTEVRPRMFWHYEHLRWRHGLPVFPICLFLRVGLNGLGWTSYEERLWDREVLRFDFAYIGLPALDGLAYLQGDNPLGLALAALMKLPAAEKARIKAEGLAKIATSRQNDVKRDLLAECFFKYLKLNDAEQAEWEEIRKQQPPEAKAVVNSIEEYGRTKALRQLVRKQLEKKFGPLPTVVVERVQRLTADRAEEIALAYPDMASLAELGLVDADPPAKPEGS